MKFWQKLCMSLFLATSSGWLYAQTATQQLQTFVQQVDAATGSFSQSTVDAQGKARPAQTGEFAFQRPGQFKWQVKLPYEQLVLSDGKQLFQYDPDLNQLTQRSVDQAIGTSPAAILFGSGKLEDSFSLQERLAEGDLAWLRATPKGSDAGFDYVDIAFQAGQPVQIILLDAFGQKTIIYLSAIETNVSFSADDFTFTPPEGVDVVILP